MTTNDFDRTLATWLDATAPASAPPNLHADAIDLVGRSRQRPRWLVAVRGGAFGSLQTAPPITRRAAWILVVLGLVMALVVGLIAAGAFRGDPLGPLLGRNGSIAFAVVGTDGSGIGVAHVVSVDGTTDTEVGPGHCPRFSGDGRVLTWREGRRDTARVLFAAPDGTQPVEVPGLGDEESSLSPDGTRLALMKRLPAIVTPTPGGGSVGRSQTELWVMPVGGGPGARIAAAPEDTDLWFQAPTWSPDGQTIAFAVMRWVMNGENSGSYRLAIDSILADGSGRRTVTPRIGTDFVGLSWSPAGDRLAYVGIPDGGPIPSLPPGTGAPTSFYPPLDVFVVNADGSGDRNLTSTPVQEIDPQWSPDGDRIAFRVQDLEIGYRLALTGADDPSLSRLHGPASAFSWSPDGARFVYVESTFGDQPRAVIWTVDSAFSEPPVLLQEVEGSVTCPPSWQHLDP